MNAKCLLILLPISMMAIAATNKIDAPKHHPGMVALAYNSNRVAQARAELTKNQEAIYSEMRENDLMFETKKINMPKHESEKRRLKQKLKETEDRHKSKMSELELQAIQIRKKYPELEAMSQKQKGKKK